jgi:hypothetical protein
MAQVLREFHGLVLPEDHAGEEEVTKAEMERHKAFREQMQRSIDRTREPATRMRDERKALEREQRAS